MVVAPTTEIADVYVTTSIDDVVLALGAHLVAATPAVRRTLKDAGHCPGGLVQLTSREPADTAVAAGAATQDTQQHTWSLSTLRRCMCTKGFASESYSPHVHQGYNFLHS